MAKINRKRLWALISLVWITFIMGYFWRDSVRGYNASYSRKIEIVRFAQKSRLHDCLARNNTNWLTVESKFGGECRLEAAAECRGSGRCPYEDMVNRCLKAKIPECRNVDDFTPEEDKDFDPDSWRNFSFYLSSDLLLFTLKTALFLFFAGPIVFAILPRAAQLLWKWVTTG